MSPTGTASAPHWVPSPNADERPATPDIIVIHYTDMASARAAVAWLTNPESRVSAHYLIGADGAVVQMVAEERRAWHAGVSHWDGTDSINARSIGIELDCPGHRPDAPTFHEPQIASLLALLDLVRCRWPVPSRNVVAHSDVAPLRKIDPGERFPWDRLAAAGHAIEVPHGLPHTPVDSALFDRALRASGYGPAVGDEEWAARLTAFHRRHRRDGVHRPLDGESMARALALQEAVTREKTAGAGLTPPQVSQKLA